MVWSIILRFAVQDISEGDRTAKDGLLLWAQKKVHEGSNGRVQVKNFHTSWQDGAAFCALINAFRPDLMEFDKVQVTKDRATMEAQLNHAFDIADTHLGVYAGCRTKVCKTGQVRHSTQHEANKLMH